MLDLREGDARKLLAQAREDGRLADLETLLALAADPLDIDEQGTTSPEERPAPRLVGELVGWVRTQRPSAGWAQPVRLTGEAPIMFIRRNGTVGALPSPVRR